MPRRIKHEGTVSDNQILKFVGTGGKGEKTKEEECSSLILMSILGSA